MRPTRPRILGIALSVVLLIVIVLLVYGGRVFGGGNAAPTPTATPPLHVVTGLVAAEDAPLFDDPTVRAIFAESGLDVVVRVAGARQIVTTANLDGVDFVFPSSGAATDMFKHKAGISTSYSPYTTVMAIASWKPVVALLAKAGLASQDANGQWILDMPKYLALVHAGVRWDQLSGAAKLYNSSKPILITSNDLRQANSAAMYLAMASYVANKSAVANSPEARAAIIDAVAPLFLNQPAITATTPAPFDDYLSNGMNAQPMVMVYESQFIARQITPDPLGPITPDMVMMYPSSSVVVKPGVVPISPLGDLVGQILTTDGRITNIAAAHGFRPGDPSAFQEVLKANGLVAPKGPDHFADLPSYESLADLIATIAARFPDPPSGAGELGLADQ